MVSWDWCHLTVLHSVKASLCCLPRLWTISSVTMYTWCSWCSYLEDRPICHWGCPHDHSAVWHVYWWGWECTIHRAESKEAQGRLHLWLGSDSLNTLKLASMDSFQFPRTLDRAKAIVRTAGQHVALGRSSIILHLSGSRLQRPGATLGEDENSTQKNPNPAGTQGSAVRQVHQKTMHLSIICLVKMLLGFKLRH